MPERSDEELMLASGRGDRRAFGLLADRHYRDVMLFAQRFLGTIGRETAEDLAQDVFLKVWKAAPRFEPRAAVKTWLLRATTNTCLDYRRRHRLRQALSLSRDTPRGEPVDHASGPASASEIQERADRSRRAIAALPSKQRAAIVLRHYHDFSYSEIAETLKLSVPAVESLLFRARRSLRAELTVDADRASPQVLPGMGAEYV